MIEITANCDCGDRAPAALEAIIALTQDLIRFKTMHGEMAEITACAAFVEAFLTRHGIAFSRFIHEGYPTLLVMPDADDPVCRVLLLAHLDVVDAPEALFTPVVRDGRIYGRGAIDDKYAAALALVLLKERMIRLRSQAKTQKNLGFGVLLTTDEEIGGHHGVGRAVESLRPEFCIALDGGKPATIIVKEKGLLTVRLTARGKAAHGSRPWLGDNAVDRLIEDYLALKTLFETPAAGSWCKTMNLGIISAGKSFNQVPDRAEAVLDVRYTEDDDPAQLYRQMQETIAGELSVIRQEPMFMGGESPYLDRLCEIVPDARLGFEHGASDARFFSQKGIAGIIWGADGESSAHAENEHVTIDSILALYRALRRFVEGLETE